MKLKFDKVQACGNDFILTEEILGSEQIAAICDRHHGIGADGVMVVVNIEKNLIKFNHYDPDGSRSFCLNGIRAGLTTLFAKELIPSQGRVCSEGVDMEYGLKEEVAIGLAACPYRPVIWRSSQEEIPGFFCDVGNPHFICWDIPELTFRQLAPRIRADDDLFPNGTNVNWLGPTKEGWLIRTYERGVEDFTLACGSGMYASALVLSGERHLNQVVFLPEGKGRVETKWQADTLWMSGSAAWVATGVWRC